MSLVNFVPIKGSGILPNICLRSTCLIDVNYLRSNSIEFNKNLQTLISETFA